MLINWRGKLIGSCIRIKTSLFAIHHKLVVGVENHKSNLQSQTLARGVDDKVTRGVKLLSKSMEVNEGSSGVRVGNLEWLYTSGRRVCPALGLSWANCVNSRLFLSRYEVIEGVENASPNADYTGFVNRPAANIAAFFYHALHSL